LAVFVQVKAKRTAASMRSDTRPQTPWPTALNGGKSPYDPVVRIEGVVVRDIDTNRFYALLDRLGQQLGGPRQLLACDDSSGWPRQGVYFFFEAGEQRRQGRGHRVVRVGTHALRIENPAVATLWDRLAQHRGRQLGDIGGPRRSHSVFRRHIGTAIIKRHQLGDEVCDNWYHYRSQPLEERIELAVSEYIGAMPFLWLDVPDSKGRHDIEAGAIGLLSGRTGDADPPSADWLGRHAYKTEIQCSGLWNVQQTREPYDPGFLKLMEERLGEIG
jgi:hypothetical protein